MLSGSNQNPHLPRLNALFLSKEKSDDGEKIWAYICKNPDAVNCLFVLDRNILHMAVVRKKGFLVKKLLQQYPELINQHDRMQQTAFHNVIMSYDYGILAMLIEAVPELMDSQRNDGQTPLHLALHSKNKSAIQHLVKAKANIYMTDDNGTSPYMLAEEFPDLLASICAWGKIIHREKTDVSLPQSKDSVDDLSKKFSLLKINPAVQSFAISSTAQAQQQLPKSTNKLMFLKDVISGDINTFQQYLEQQGDPDAKHIFDCPLVLHFFLQATSLSQDQDGVKQLYANKFLLLTKYALISQTDSNGRTLLENLEHNASVKVQLLKQAYSELRLLASRLIRSNTDSIKAIGDDFEDLLLFAGLNQLKLANKYNQKGLESRPAPFNRMEIVDDLCKGITPYNKEITYNPGYISNMTYGLLSALSAKDILAHLKNSWPQYNFEQRLIANFIVKELMIIDFCRDLHLIDKTEIEFMLEGNTQTFPLHAPKMNAFFGNVFEYRDILLENPIYINHKMLLTWQKENLQHYQMPSFGELIKATANLPRKKQKPYIKQIADELSSVSGSKFAAIQMEEFFNTAWSKHDAQETSPNIMACIQMTNNLVRFIQEIILSAKDIQEAQRLYELFVNVAARLCRSKNPSGPDMASVFIIMGALNSADVNKIKRIFGEMEKGIDKKLDYINELINPSKNYAWLRKLELSHQVSIPYLGKLLTDITFMYEGNENWLIVCELMGIEFKNLMKRQANILSVTKDSTTDLTNMLITYPFVSEDKIYELSSKWIPPEITIDSYSFLQLLFAVDNYVNKKVLPNINYNGKCYKGPNIIDPIFWQFKKHIICEGTSETLNEDYIKARKLIGDLILLINSRYSDTTINYMSYTFALNEIKSEVKSMPVLNKEASAIIYTSVEKSNSSTEKPQKKKSFRHAGLF